MTMFFRIFPLVALLACRDPQKPDDSAPPDDTGPVDMDGDGFPAGVDCDDSDAAIHPGAPEDCDGVDDDCDGEVDEGAMGTWYADADGDGWGDALAPTEACDQPSGAVTDSTDCDDADAQVHPGAPERCDGLDEDCDGEVDEDLVELWYADADGDGWGVAETTLESCDPGAGWASDPGDCDDADDGVYPGAEETCDGADQDCDGEVDDGLLTAWCGDTDGDGYGDPGAPLVACDPGPGWVVDCSDCDDANSAIHPDALERCDGYDDDCDGLMDDADLPVVDAVAWYLDADGDGWGDSASAILACEAPSGHVALDGDCDDTDPAINPGAAEDDCTDPVDYNCDGSTGYADGDGDGWAACLDCDDGDAAVNPEGIERCDGVDDDCDGEVDEDDALDAATWYLDADGDGDGSAAASLTACSAPAGYAATATDCDDGDAAVHPGSAEDCDGVDDDCDGATDEGVMTVFYADVDGDGWGDAASTAEACAPPAGFVPDAGDCDDTAGAVNPDATEICDGVDDDCDGTADEADAADASTWFGDLDGDGYGSAAATTLACTQPSGYVAVSGDCDDGDGGVHPGADEHCDGADEDCDGAADDAPVDPATWFDDADGDGWGDPTSATEACTAPSGTVADDRDCDDTRAAVHPGATETCDGLDDDCDGLVDDDDPGVTGTSTWYADADADGYGARAYTTRACAAPSGYVALGTDCDDTEPEAWPGNDEVCDTLDNDCDGAVDEADAVDAATWYLDADGDGWGDASAPRTACTRPSGYTAAAGDCDEADPTVNPAAEEVCDGVDNDCNGFVDDDPTDGDTWYADLDGDGYGDPASAQTTCSQPSGTVADATDCDDDHATAYPGSTATEVPFDGVDQDCDEIDACTDLNCDGLPDLLFPSYRADTTWNTLSRAYFGTGHGFAASYGTTFPAVGVLGAVVEDLDGDGYQDVVLGGYYNGSSYLVDSYVYWGSAAGYSTSDRSTLATDGVIAVRAADLDHDGWTDLVFASHYNGSYVTTSYVYWGSAAGVRDADRTALPTYGAYDVEIADLDGDGWEDIVFAQYYTGSSHTANGYVYWGSAAGYSAGDRTTLPVAGAVDVEVADLNEDGWLDVVFASYYSGSSYASYSYVYWGSAAGPVSTNYDALYTVGAWDIASGDLDGDGYTDLVFASYYTGSSYTTTSYVYWGNSGGYSAADRTGLTSYGARAVVAEDLDQDGWGDLFFAQYYSGSTYSFNSWLYWGSSAGHSTADLTALPTDGAFRAQAADVDEDGWLDLIVNCHYGGTYSVDSFVYYGSASGYSSSDRDDLPVDGPWGDAVVVGL